MGNGDGDVTVMEHEIAPQSTPAAATDALLTAEHVRIGYTVGRTFNLAVADVSFDIRPGETLMLLGPSGCGKSTLLKTIAGFLQPIGGRIAMAGRDSLVPGPDRAVVFQEFDQLFPWRTVLDNVAYPLRRNGWSKQDAADSARRHLEIAGLASSLERFPHQLSGGMKQRVAIARALALEPTMLLMDEPFGSLDALTRSRLQRELGQIASRLQATILFVTHSIEEAIVLGNRVVILSQPPSTVREIYPVPDQAKDPESASYAEALTHLRGLLESSGEEADDDDVLT